MNLQFIGGWILLILYFFVFVAKFVLFFSVLSVKFLVVCVSLGHVWSYSVVRNYYLIWDTGFKPVSFAYEANILLTESCSSPCDILFKNFLLFIESSWVTKLLMIEALMISGIECSNTNPFTRSVVFPVSSSSPTTVYPACLYGTCFSFLLGTMACNTVAERIGFLQIIHRPLTEGWAQLWWCKKYPPWTRGQISVSYLHNHHILSSFLSPSYFIYSIR